jgi:predicted transcriptional regulator
VRCTLRLTRALFVFLLTLILFSSLATLVYSHGNRIFSATVPTSPHNSLVTLTPFVFGVAHLDKPPPLNQSTRTEVFNFVKTNPGIHFRGICVYLNLSVGVAQYHLGLLTKAGLISFFRDGRYKRYFRSKEFGEHEMKIFSLLRHKTAGEILSILSERQQLSHKDLASRLRISSQALTWQINRLRKMELISFVTEGMKVRYFLDLENTAIVKRCLDFIS